MVGLKKDNCLFEPSILIYFVSSNYDRKSTLSALRLETKR